MKKISKIFSVILSILMVAFCFPVYAESNNVTMTISTDVSDMKVGDTITVSVVLSENSKLNYFTIDLVYDNNVLEYSSHTVNDVYGNVVSNGAYAENKIRVVAANTEPITYGGIVVNATFVVLSSSCSSVSLDVVESANGNFEDIPVAKNTLILHSYGQWVTETEPTCENAGQKSKTCSCGEKTIETIDALGHDYATEFTTDVEPNCTETGSKSQHCSRCDSKQNVTEIPAIGHTEEEIPAVVPTCTATGLTAGVKCSVCDEILTAQTEVSSTGHDYKEEIIKIPTHTENGEKKFTCNNCGDTYTEIITADGTHKHISVVTKEPTCTEEGIMTYTCACGDSYTETISALGHTPENAVEENYIAPTCTDKGCKDMVVYCSVCDEELSREIKEIDALGHTEEEIPAVASTCIQTGLTEGAKCSVCDEILLAQEEIPATGHSVNEDGYCGVCDEKLCDHNCHKGGISGFFWKIANFFNKLFGLNKYCECGYAHY